ncbi:CFF_HP2_G0000780.mRNA.1.CDS.1 [Saccharomyces cerevisiae]|nr:CFF_HP2_G0000780.mRNA.1.CDS.1 [Saccharomyces cerevisiae]CAI6457150.1 CFF_HP2_G0000780.mRNA.1.CDS.1 [Saccharomyces cerevisiae]
MKRLNFTFHSGPRSKYLSKAAEIERQAQENYGKDDIAIWVRMCSINEENGALLPKDIFRSYLSYWIYEGAHCKPIMVMFLAAVILISLTNFRVYHLMSLLSSFFISGTDRQ